MNDTATARGAAELARAGFEYGTMRSLDLRVGETVVVASQNSTVTGELALVDGWYVLKGTDGMILLQMGSPRAKQFARAWEPA